jgi:hypothetical protein
MPHRLQLFSVEEANRLIPDLRPELERLSAIQRELDRLQSRIDVLTLAVSGAAAGNPDTADLRRLLGRRGPLAEQLSQGAKAIERRGCLVKDAARGLVDFHALSGDRLVFLCWRMDEPEVGHWHVLDGGYARRQPLDRSELE